MENPPILIHLANGIAPVPEGWTLEEVIHVLREMNHSILRVESEGKEIPVPNTEEAA